MIAIHEGKDVPENQDFPYDLSQKFVAIGAVVRFLVFDDSSKSGHIRELELARNNNWITVVLRQAGGDSSYMTAGLSDTSTVIREVSYDLENLHSTLSDPLKWAEGRYLELNKARVQIYPWRTTNDNSPP
jgi:hypothetical protein